jgi:hypothetical protein
MSFQEYTKEKLWPVLVEAVHALVMFPSHKTYTREVIFSEKPDINPPELAAKLKIPLGEAIVILCELAEERNPDS